MLDLETVSCRFEFKLATPTSFATAVCDTEVAGVFDLPKPLQNGSLLQWLLFWLPFPVEIERGFIRLASKSGDGDFMFTIAGNR